MGGWRREREGSGWRERRGRPKEDSRVSERKLESVVKYKRRLPRRSNQPLRREQITVQTTFLLDPREERERGEKGGDASAVSTRVAATKPLLAARRFFFILSRLDLIPRDIFSGGEGEFSFLIFIKKIRNPNRPSSRPKGLLSLAVFPFLPSTARTETYRVSTGTGYQLSYQELIQRE